jgi:hypothetical protein
VGEESEASTGQRWAGAAESMRDNEEREEANVRQKENAVKSKGHGHATYATHTHINILLIISMFLLLLTEGYIVDIY